eukprot:13848-Heterococcus_DN1.PRE.1
MIKARVGQEHSALAFAVRALIASSRTQQQQQQQQLPLLELLALNKVARCTGSRLSCCCGSANAT